MATYMCKVCVCVCVSRVGVVALCSIGARHAPPPPPRRPCASAFVGGPCMLVCRATMVHNRPQSPGERASAFTPLVSVSGVASALSFRACCRHRRMCIVMAWGAVSVSRGWALQVCGAGVVLVPCEHRCASRGSYVGHGSVGVGGVGLGGVFSHRTSTTTTASSARRRRATSPPQGRLLQRRRPPEGPLLCVPLLRTGVGGRAAAASRRRIARRRRPSFAWATSTISCARGAVLSLRGGRGVTPCDERAARQASSTLGCVRRAGGVRCKTGLARAHRSWNRDFRVVRCPHTAPLQRRSCPRWVSRHTPCPSSNRALHQISLLLSIPLALPCPSVSPNSAALGMFAPGLGAPHRQVLARMRIDTMCVCVLCLGPSKGWQPASPASWEGLLKSQGALLVAILGSSWSCKALGAAFWQLSTCAGCGQVSWGVGPSQTRGGLPFCAVRVAIHVFRLFSERLDGLRCGPDPGHV